MNTIHSNLQNKSASCGCASGRRDDTDYEAPAFTIRKTPTVAKETPHISSAVLHCIGQNVSALQNTPQGFIIYKHSAETQQSPAFQAPKEEAPKERESFKQPENPQRKMSFDKLLPIGIAAGALGTGASLAYAGLKNSQAAAQIESSIPVNTPERWIKALAAPVIASVALIGGAAWLNKDSFEVMKLKAEHGLL